VLAKYTEHYGSVGKILFKAKGKGKGPVLAKELLT